MLTPTQKNKALKIVYDFDYELFDYLADPRNNIPDSKTLMAAIQRNIDSIKALIKKA